jgi:hypothetical protein
MSRGVVVVAGVALAALLLGMHAAVATPCPSIGCVAPHAAPAPLLAAGIPAFAALGGGALIARLVRKLKRSQPR